MFPDRALPFFRSQRVAQQAAKGRCAVAACTPLATGVPTELHQHILFWMFPDLALPFSVRLRQAYGQAMDCAVCAALHVSNRESITHFLLCVNHYLEDSSPFLRFLSCGFASQCSLNRIITLFTLLLHNTICITAILPAKSPPHLLQILPGKHKVQEKSTKKITQKKILFSSFVLLISPFFLKPSLIFPSHKIAE